VRQFNCNQRLTALCSSGNGVLSAETITKVKYLFNRLD
jgi:hypothetical protein